VTTGTTPAATPGPHESLLFVHAHPDDETLATGVALAHYRARGQRVRVLTCTLGEEGEVIPDHLEHLASDRDGALGPWRREELRRAMAALGVEHQVLGEDPDRGTLSRYRDSGMAGTPTVAHPRALVNADLGEAAALVAQVIRDVGATVVVTYDEHGGYRHPDHIKTHRVTCAAVASLPPAERPALYAVVTPRSWAEEDREWLGSGVPPTCPWRVPGPGDPFPPSVVDDGLVSHQVVDPSVLPAQAEALRAHQTQVTVADGYYALSNDIAARLPGREGYAPLDPVTGALVPSPGGGVRHTSLLVGEQ
jgi:N-acetyl-1-D-myo-inositol-2-amino-2-deoxy-alpha-D-glucopyranoside deacetylase